MRADARVGWIDFRGCYMDTPADETDPARVPALLLPLPDGTRVDENRESASLDALVRAEVAVSRLKVALALIMSDAPTTEPEYDDWGGDTERAETWGGEQEHWRLAQIARDALAVVEGAAR
jgi:hypothetical protein